MAGYRANLTFYNNETNPLSGNAQTEVQNETVPFPAATFASICNYVSEVSFGSVCMEANTPTTRTVRQKFGKMF
jgi:hypothetical protein